MRASHRRTCCLLLPLVLLAGSQVCCVAQGEQDVAPDQYPLDEEGFVRDWLVAGPYPNPPGDPYPAGYEGDPLERLGGEAAVEPYAGMTDEAEFLADKGRLIAGIGSTNAWGFTETKVLPVQWAPIHWEEESPIISLDDRFGEIRDWLVAYAACWVLSRNERNVQIRVGSDDGYKLYLNHESLGGISLSRAAAEDQNVHQGRLREGLNLVLLKISERTGGHAFCLRITDGKGEPYDDLAVVLSHPKREYALGCQNLDEVDVVDREGFAQLRLGEEPRFPGTLGLRAMVGLATETACSVRVLVTDGGDREVFSDTLTAELSPDRAYPIEAEVTIDRPGDATVAALVMDAQGDETLAHLERAFEVLDPDALRLRRDQLRHEVAERRERRAALEARLAEAEQEVAALRDRVAEQYERIQAIYARRREVLSERYGEEARSIEEPFEPVATAREVLCLNGDGWEIAGARSLGRYAIDAENPPEEGWEPGWVPMMGVEKYFRGRYFPARGDGGPYRPTKVLDCAPDGWTLSDARIGDGLWYRTTIEIPQRWSDRHVFFHTEYAQHLLKVYLDGELCGTHSGWPGVIDIELPNATPGRHELLVLTQRARSVGEWSHLNQYFGLLGDVFLTTCSDVAVTDTWVITSWRDATVENRVWLLNRGEESRTVTVACEAVLDGKTRLRLDSRQVELKPGTRAEVRLTRPWTDPQLWGIGGEYGDPTLYQMVTTVSEGDRVLDQHYQRFGFRELWIAGFHYYLNGKRIFIQGDNFGAHVTSRPALVLLQKALRESANVNAIRNHFWFQQGLCARVADELGMLVLPQWYPDLGAGPNALSVEEFLTTQRHRDNLRRYARWVRWLRNHPSVVIYCTDNEIFTQAWDTPEKLEANIRNDRLGAVYGRYVKALDPTRLVTRDGDEGTWGKLGKWQQQPPAEIANYHYPDFNVDDLVENWQSLYEKPVLFGETLYCSYGAWDGWIDAIPSQVAAKARRVRDVVGTYRDLEVSGWVGMGPGNDCFTELKEDGSGNPWGVSPAIIAEYKANGQVESLPHYPYFPIDWPSLSGPGLKPEFYRFQSVYGHGSINPCDAGRPVYVPNAVNAAYQDATWPMPPLSRHRPTEALVTVTEHGEPVPLARLVLTPADGQASEPLGVRADTQGRAWVLLEEPGRYDARVEGKETATTLDFGPIGLEMQAGFGYLPRLEMEVGQ